MDTQGIFDGISTAKSNATVFALSTMVSSVQVMDKSHINLSNPKSTNSNRSTTSQRPFKKTICNIFSCSQTTRVLLWKSVTVWSHFRHFCTIFVKKRQNFKDPSFSCPRLELSLPGRIWTERGSTDFGQTTTGNTFATQRTATTSATHQILVWIHQMLLDAASRAWSCDKPRILWTIGEWVFFDMHMDNKFFLMKNSFWSEILVLLVRTGPKLKRFI